MFFLSSSARAAPKISPSTGYLSGKFHNLQQEVISGSNLPTSVYPLTKKWTYQVNFIQDSNNNVTAYVVDKANHSETDDASGHVWECQDTTYDEGAAAGVATPAAGWPTTQKSDTTCGNSATALTSYTAYDQYGNIAATVDPLGAANPGLYSNHGCSASGAVYVSASWTAGHYTRCATYDTNSTASLPISTQNVLGETSSTSYDYTSSLLPSSTTDINGQLMSFNYAYDSHGSETINISEPGETGSYTSKQNENTACTTNSTQPCYEIDKSISLYSNVVSRTFYDAQGRAVETRTPGPTPRRRYYCRNHL